MLHQRGAVAIAATGVTQAVNPAMVVGTTLRAPGIARRIVRATTGMPKPATGTAGTNSANYQISPILGYVSVGGRTVVQRRSSYQTDSHSSVTITIVNRPRQVLRSPPGAVPRLRRLQRLLYGDRY